VRAEQIAQAAVAARCRNALAAQLATDLDARRQWDVAVRDRWVYNKTSFSRLSCPFRAILELWRTGYTLVDIDEHAVTLGARRR
jgi:hypothetical protein